MRLLNILANDLKQWPQNAVTIDQSSVDGELYGYDSDDHLFLTGIHLIQAEDFDTHVTQAEWQEAVQKINGAERPSLSAFPTYEAVGQVVLTTGGMTLRDYFAAKAMSAIIMNPETQHELRGLDGPQGCQVISTIAYAQADAMLAAREVEQ